MNDGPLQKFKRDNNSLKINKIIKPTVSDPPNSVTKEYVETIVRDCLNKIMHVSELTTNLTLRIKNIEKEFVIKDLAGKLNKHYEQSRCCK